MSKEIGMEKISGKSWTEFITSQCTPRLWADVKEVEGFWPTALPVHPDLRCISWRVRAVRRKGLVLGVELLAIWGATDPKRRQSADPLQVLNGSESDRKNYIIDHVLTNVQIFPLTPQQAAFVGTEIFPVLHYKEKSLLYPTVYWGNTEDVLKIKKEFPPYLI